MNKKEQRRELARRTVFVGCQICGATDRPLRNYEGYKICPKCLARKQQRCPVWTPERSKP